MVYMSQACNSVNFVFRFHHLQTLCLRHCLFARETEVFDTEMAFFMLRVGIHTYPWPLIPHDLVFKSP